MKVEVFNAHNRHMILKHAFKENNVSRTCELFGISRTTFYNWNRAYQKYGIIGLKVKEPSKPKMPNKVNKAIECDILSYIERFPTDGPKRIYYELRTEGCDVGESGIYNVLRRHNLSTKAERIQYAKNKTHQFNAKQKKKVTLGFEITEESNVGALVIQRIDFMGTFEGIGKIYQYSLYDTYSKWALVKIYNKKQDINVWDYFELKLVYLMKTLNLNIDLLVTEKSKEFLPYFIKGDQHKEIVGNFFMNHRFVEPEKNSVLDAMNDFNEFLVREFYNKIGQAKHLDSFYKVERELHKYLRNYNFSIEISSGCNAGKTPAKVIFERAIQNNVEIDTLPLWILALIKPSTKRGNQNE